MKGRVHVSCSRQPALTRGKELFGTIGWRDDSAGPLPSACGNRSFVRSRPTSNALIRSEEHTSELQSLMRISYAVFCLKKKTSNNQNNTELLKNNSTQMKANYRKIITTT